MPAKKKNKTRVQRVLKTLNPRNLRGGMALFALVFVLAGGGYYAYKSFAAEAIYDTADQAQLKTNEKRGLGYGSLRLIKQNADHPCAGVFELPSVKSDKHVAKCTHGPDPAPEGTDITDENQINGRLDSIYKLIDVSSKKKLTSAENVQLNSLTSSAATTTALPNYACQTNNQKVVIIYGYTGTNNVNLVAPYFQEWSRHIDAEYLAASNNHRRINWYTTDNTCKPTVLTRSIPNWVYDIADSSVQYDRIVAYLKSINVSRSSSKYLVYLDHNTDSRIKICGMANFDGDPTPGLTNKNNTQTGYAMIGPGCWLYAETHEIIHMLGADNGRSPNSSGGGHCRDENDVLCYDDYGSTADNITRNGPMSRPCNVATPVIDCGKNDYFNVSPSSTNYLYTHWNTANSGFLKRL